MAHAVEHCRSMPMRQRGGVPAGHLRPSGHPEATRADDHDLQAVLVLLPPVQAPRMRGAPSLPRARAMRPTQPQEDRSEMNEKKPECFAYDFGLQQYADGVSVRLDVTPRPTARRARGRRPDRWSCGPKGYAAAVEVITRCLPDVYRVELEVGRGLFAVCHVPAEARVEVLQDKLEAIRRLIRIKVMVADDKDGTGSLTADTITAELRALRPRELLDDIAGTLSDTVDLWRRVAIDTAGRGMVTRVERAEAGTWARAADMLESIGQQLAPGFPYPNVRKPTLVKTCPWVCPGCGEHGHAQHRRGCELVSMRASGGSMDSLFTGPTMVDELNHAKSILERIARLSGAGEAALADCGRADAFQLGGLALGALADPKRRPLVLTETEGEDAAGMNWAPSGADQAAVLKTDLASAQSIEGEFSLPDSIFCDNIAIAIGERFGIGVTVEANLGVLSVRGVPPRCLGHVNRWLSDVIPPHLSAKCIPLPARHAK